MKVLVTYRSMSSSLGIIRNGETVDLPESEVKKILVTKPSALKILHDEAPKKPTPKRKAPARKPATKRETNAKSVK